MSDGNTRSPRRSPSPEPGRSYKLTPAFVRRIATEIPPDREIHYADQDLPRHYIRVRPPSAPGKSWPVESRVRYTLPGGRRPWLNVGNPRTMSLEALRAAARAALAIVDAGGDPAAERAKEAAQWTVRDLWAAYQVAPEFHRCVPKSQQSIVAAFTLHIVHHLGREALTSIDVPMVRRLLRAITADIRTNVWGHKLGGAGAGKKAVRLFSAALSWAVAEGKLDRNPIVGGGLRLEAGATREAVITEPAQYAELFATMDRMVERGELRGSVRAFITVAALTGMRRGELRTLRWGDVDLARRRITLMSSKGAKLARGGPKGETISLPPIAAAALAEICAPDATADEPVFPPRQGEHLAVNPDWRRVRAAAGLPADLTLHGLRHSVGTVGVLAGLSAHEVQALLRHRNIATSARYVHLAEATRARLQDRVAQHVLPDETPTAEVVPLPTRR